MIRSSIEFANISILVFHPGNNVMNVKTQNCFDYLEFFDSFGKIFESKSSTFNVGNKVVTIDTLNYYPVL